LTFSVFGWVIPVTADNKKIGPEFSSSESVFSSQIISSTSEALIELSVEFYFSTFFASQQYKKN
jgi:hypothetical protein